MMRPVLKHVDLVFLPYLMIRRGVGWGVVNVLFS